MKSLENDVGGKLLERESSGVDEDQTPGRNQWITGLCRAAGFKPRFLASPDGITNVFSLVDSESAVTLVPDYFGGFKHPGTVFVPVSDENAKRDFIVLWQRGKVPASTVALVEALAESVSDLPQQNPSVDFLRRNHHLRKLPRWQ